MSPQFDTAFAGAAVKRGLLTSEQVALGAKIRKVLGDLGISKTLAVIAVEAKWIELDEALTLVTGLRKQGVDHPELKPREASEADESVLERLTPVARKRLETASRTLASLFYARGAGTLALDQGSPAAAAGRGFRKPSDPTPTPAPARRLKPPLEVVAPPPPKSNALGAILAAAAAVVAIIGLVVFKKGKPTVPELEPPSVTAKPPPPPPRPPAPPPKPSPPPPTDATPDEKPTEPPTDATVEERRKLYIEEQERVAATRYEEVKQLMTDGRPASARGKLKKLREEFGWTEFVKTRAGEIARLTKELEAEASAPEEAPDTGPEPVAEGPALPAMAAALKRLDDGASSDTRRAAAAKTRLAGSKSDLLLRGGKVVKGAEIVDISREDLRVRGEIDGTKVDLLLAWTALEASSFLSVQKQISRGQGAAGLFELGRAAVQCRLWKDAKAAFDECARTDAAWKPRLPDIAAILADPAILRGTARRLGDGRLLVEYSFTDSEQAADFVPVTGTSGTATVAGGSLKFASKQGAFWTLKDVAFEGDVDVTFETEGPGEVAVALTNSPANPLPVFYFGPGKVRVDSGKPEPIDSARPVTVRRKGHTVLVVQDDREIWAMLDAADSGPRRVVIGATSDAGIRNLAVLGEAPGEMARRLGPLERLEGGAHAGDFRLEPAPLDPETRSRAALAEAALEAGHLEEAWSLAEEAVAKAPAGGLAIAVRGLIRHAQGELRLAVADADLALALDPCHGEVMIRARRILAALRGPGALGAFRRKQAGPWDVRADASEERLNFYAGKLEEASKRFAEALKDAGPEPKGVRAVVFSSREAYFLYLEISGGRGVAVIDVPGAERELIRLGARAYLRAAVAAPPAWFEEGMSAFLAGVDRSADMKAFLAKSPPLEALLKKSGEDYTESDRIQAASVVRFLLAGAHKGVIPDLLKKLRHEVPAIEAFSGKDLKKLDAEWRTWAAADGGK